MKQYQILEEFLITAIKDCQQRWHLETSVEPFMLSYIKNDGINGTSYSEIRFSAIHFNELAIDIKSSNLKHKSIVVNINKVPNLMEYLTNGQLNFQMQASIELGDKFKELDNLVDKILYNGKTNNKKATIREEEQDIIEFVINKDRNLKLIVHDINGSHLNFQVISVEANFEDINNFPIKYKKLISLEKLKELPFLNSLAKIPKIKRAELAPNIEKFMDFVANMGCKNISPIAKTISLSYNLETSLDKKENLENKKSFKL